MAKTAADAYILYEVDSWHEASLSVAASAVRQAVAANSRTQVLGRLTGFARLQPRPRKPQNGGAQRDLTFKDLVTRAAVAGLRCLMHQQANHNSPVKHKMFLLLAELLHVIST